MASRVCGLPVFVTTLFLFFSLGGWLHRLHAQLEGAGPREGWQAEGGALRVSVAQSGGGWGGEPAIAL